MGRQLLTVGYIARVGTVMQSGFVDSADDYYILIVLPDLAARRGAASLDYGTVQWSTPATDDFRPLDPRTMSASVVGTAWRYDYRSNSPYMVYFVHVLAGDDDRFTVSRRFADTAELHKALCRRYASRVLPNPPKERKLESDNRAALQAYLVALIDCRFLASEHEFLRFFRDMAADTAAPLSVMRQEEVPLEEAFLLLGPSFRDVAMREKAVARLEREDVRSLITYLLFLTSALGHEPQPKNALLEFMLKVAAQSDEFATLFYWYLTVEVSEISKPSVNFSLALEFLMTQGT